MKVVWSSRWNGDKSSRIVTIKNWEELLEASLKRAFQSGCPSIIMDGHTMMRNSFLREGWNYAIKEGLITVEEDNSLFLSVV